MAEERAQDLLWNSDFSVKIEMRGKQQLKYLPNYVYSVGLPEILMLPSVDGNAFELEENSVGQMSLTVRTDKDRLVIDEIFMILSGGVFDISIFFPKSTLMWEFKKCMLDRLKPCEFISKKKFDSPYNIELPICPKTAIYYGHGIRFICGEDEEGKKNGE